MLLGLSAQLHCVIMWQFGGVRLRFGSLNGHVLRVAVLFQAIHVNRTLRRGYGKFLFVFPPNCQIAKYLGEKCIGAAAGYCLCISTARMGIHGLMKLIGDYAPSAMKDHDIKSYFGGEVLQYSLYCTGMKLSAIVPWIVE